MVLWNLFMQLTAVNCLGVNINVSSICHFAHDNFTFQFLLHPNENIWSYSLKCLSLLQVVCGVDLDSNIT
jgi:hypothetical protein